MTDAARRTRCHAGGMPRSRPAAETPGEGDDPSSARRAGVPEEAPGSIRLLLVDRDVRVRAAMSQTVTLEDDLVVVAEAADAGQALALADGTRPSVALVDLLLPDTGTGLRLVRSLSRRPGCAVVAMSGRGGMREAALAAGARALVDKSGDIDAILDTIRACSSV
jgi:DNA-binding NarL/FixJ family response regulator